MSSDSAASLHSSTSLPWQKPAPASAPAHKARPPPRRAALNTSTGLFAGGNRCFCNAALQQLATDPVLPKLLDQAIEFTKGLHRVDEKSVDLKQSVNVCSALSPVVIGIRTGKPVADSAMDALCNAIKLGGLSQQDSHEAFIKIADSIPTLLKSPTEVRS